MRRGHDSRILEYNSLHRLSALALKRGPGHQNCNGVEIEEPNVKWGRLEEVSVGLGHAGL
jgi:hypothetical protein